MMAKRHRLRALQMREARHDRLGLGVGPLDQRQLQHLDLRQERVDGVAHIEPEIGRHLVVARTRRVQPPRRVADQLAQPRFDIHVNVFERARKVELLRFRSRPARAFSPVDDGVAVLVRQNARLGKHGGMGD